LYKILVIGGAGYIGSKVAYDLLDLGYDVSVIDNLSTGYKKLIPTKSKFTQIDIKNYKKLNSYFFYNNFDAIFHFAASLSVKESQNKPLKYYKNNVLGIDNVLKCVSRYQIKYFIFSSTCAVYGNVKKIPINERCPLNPESNYGKTKMLAEYLLKNYAKKYKFKYAILRYFNVVGADSKMRTGQIYKGPLFKNLSINLIKKNFSIKIFGNDYNTNDGTCIRDYIDINDLSKIHTMSLIKLFKFKSFVLNCGYGKGYSVKEIVDLFEKIIKKKIIKIYNSKRIGDIERIYSNNYLLKKIFPNWKREFSIETSINNSLKWEKKICFLK
jgi:UDP-glucose 4-epimerase